MALAVGLGGCRYRGAVYASYEEAGLGIKTSAESDSPIKVHFGYDRGVGAWVPRRGGDAQHEEATALISRDDVRAGVNPLHTGTESLLQVDGAIISGTAAIVAAAPADAEVIVKEPRRVRTDAGVVTEEQEPTLKLRTTGSAGARIASAVAAVPRLSSQQLTLRRLIATVAERSDSATVFRAAATKVSPSFKQTFDRGVAAALPPDVAFGNATLDYREEVKDETKRLGQLIAALRAANQGVH
jgi:hypothetical protein